MKGSGIGGQAVMEGVMMKNGDNYAVAVRKEDGEIVVDTQVFKKTGGGRKVFELPVIRGVIAFIDSLRLGVGTLMYSATFFEDEEENNKKKKKTAAQKKRSDAVMMTVTVVLAVILAIGIFMILPYFLSQLLKKVITSTALLTVCEGIIRIALFIGYIAAISCMKDIKRVFMYHGAEHKSINCIENGFELTVENVRKASRRHKRCGTSFLLIVMLISIFFFMFIRVDQAWLRVVLRLVLIPVIAGISYEFIRLAGRSNSPLVNALSKPGLALQGLTTSEPDDSMIEVAIASVEAVFDWRNFLENYDSVEEKCDLTGEPVNEGKHSDENEADRSAASVLTDSEKAADNAQKQEPGRNDNHNNRKQNNQKHNKQNGQKNNQKQNKANDQKQNDRKQEERKQDGKSKSGKFDYKAANERLQNAASGKASGSPDKKKNPEDVEKKIKAQLEEERQFARKARSERTMETVKADTSEDENTLNSLDTILEEKKVSPEISENPGKTEKSAGIDREMARRKINPLEAVPVEDEEDDEILRALDQFFIMGEDKPEE